MDIQENDEKAAAEKGYKATRTQHLTSIQYTHTTHVPHACVRSLI